MKSWPSITLLLSAALVLSVPCAKASPVGVSQLGLVVSELMYHPSEPSQEELDGGFTEASLFEFIEVANVSGNPLQCQGLMLSGSIAAEVTESATLQPDESVVLVAHPEAFASRYGLDARVIGTFTGELPDATGFLQLRLGQRPALSFTYQSTIPWPITPHGLGFSLTQRDGDAFADHNRADRWRASAEPGGSPGRMGSEPRTLPVYINEVLPRDRVLDTYYRIAAYPVHPDQAPTAFIGQFVQDMQADPYKFTFIHLVSPDFVGHSYNWYSPQQDDAIRAVDKDIGEVFNLVEGDERLRGKTAIILTSDHAGGGGVVLNNHIDPIWPKNYTIPFHVWGPGIPAGADLYELNANTRTIPNPEQNPITSLDTAAMPIRNGDLGNLALSLLGLPAIPGSWMNHDQSLSTGAEGVEYVIGISVDGLGPLSLNRLGAEELPNLFRLRTEGAFTDQARTDDTHSYTNPNHTCMLTSRGTLDHANVGRGHRITFNSDVQTTIQEWNGAYIASVFDVIHAFGHSCAFFSNKTKLDFLGRSYGAIDGDAIELYNPNDTVVAIGGWGLTDDPNSPLKWTIPQNTFIPAGGYLTLREDPGWRSSARPTKLFSHFGGSFSLGTSNSAVFLFAAIQGRPSGFNHALSIGYAPTNGSIIRQATADGERFPLGNQATLGNINTTPYQSTLAFTEFALDPDTGQLRFVEIQNVSSQAVTLGPGWGLRGSFAFDFPSGSTLMPGELAVVAVAPDKIDSLPEPAPIVYGPMTPSEEGLLELRLAFIGQSDALSLDVIRPSEWLTLLSPGVTGMERRNPLRFGDDAANWAPTDEPNGSPGRITSRRYVDWVAVHFADLDESLATTEADPDADGASNLTEYAFGTDPRDKASRFQPEYVWGPAKTGIVSLSFQRPRDLADLAYEVETSTDLTTWTSANAITMALGEITSIDDHLEAITYRVAPPSGTRFLRVRVVLQP